MKKTTLLTKQGFEITGYMNYTYSLNNDIDDSFTDTIEFCAFFNC